MEGTPSSSKPQLYIQDSSDEDLPERGEVGRGKNYRQYQGKAKSGRVREESRHLIKLEVSPGSSAPKPFRGVNQLLEKPAKLNLESVEESESDDEWQADTQLIPPAALPRALQFRNEAAALVTPLPKAHSSEERSGEYADGSNRMLFDRQEQDTVEDEGEDAFATAKKQRVDEMTPVHRQKGLLLGAENPASAHRKFLASKLTNLANVPSSARRLTPKKGMGPLCHQLQQLLKQQERPVSSRCDATVKVLACGPEGQMLRAHCQLEDSATSETELPRTFLLLLKTDPRIDASPGDILCIRRPWQSIDVDGIRILMVRHAETASKPQESTFL